MPLLKRDREFQEPVAGEALSSRPTYSISKRRPTSACRRGQMNVQRITRLEEQQRAQDIQLDRIERKLELLLAELRERHESLERHP